MKKSTNAKIFSLILIFILEIAFSTPIQIAKAIDNAPVLQDSGNIATFIKGQSAVNVDSNITLTGTNNIDGARIYIGQGFIPSEDSLVFNNQNNIAGTYNPSTGVLTLSGVDTTANYQTALRSIKYKNLSTNPSTVQRKIVFSIGGKVLYCPPTKHYYEYVSSPGVRWDTAKTGAANKSYYGLTGYLVTITSQEENDFIQNKIAGNTWIGASDDVQLGNWTWRTGPEAGQCFWNRTTGSQGKTLSDGNYTYNGMYNNWDISEPNNYQNIDERYAHMYSYSGTWNDFRIDDATISGYVVEYNESNPENPTLHLTAEVALNVAIDQTAPSFTNITQTPTGAAWTDQSVTLTVNGATDNGGSGLNAEAYSFSTTQGVYNWQASNVSPAFSQNQTVYVYLRDASGNISTASTVIISNIDKTLPNTPEISNSNNYTNSNWHKTDETINAIFTPSTGCNETLQYSLNNDAWIDGSSATISQVGVNTLKFRVKDLLNRISGEASCVVQIDKTLPVITSVEGNPSDWTSSDVTLTANASDELSGLADKAYSFDGGSTWQAENTKTYTENTSNIVIKVKDAAGNIAAYSPIDITKIDKTAPNAAVIANSDKYTDSNWYKAAQTITASFTGTAGCPEKLQYKVNTGDWTDGDSVTISDEGKYDVSFKVVDSLGCTSAVQTVKVNIDKTAPANAKITIKDREFTSILNTITFGTFFKDTVNVSITADDNISGIKKIEYQKVAKDTDYNPDGTWTSGSSFNVAPDNKFIVYARITDNAGNYVVVNSDGIVVDATSPALALTPDAADWTSKDVNVKVDASDNLAGVKEVTYTTNETVPQTGTVAINSGAGNIKLSNEGQYKLTVTAKDNSLNEVSQTANIKLDKTAPAITSVTGNPSDWTSNNVILTVNASDTLSGLAATAYSFDGGSTWQAENTKTYTENTSNIVVKVRDAVGNIAAYSPMDITKIDRTAPNAAVIANSDKYTESNWYNAAQTITGSFTGTAGCPEKLQYKVNTGDWTDGGSVTISDEGKHDVSFRVADSLGCTSAAQTVKVNIDNTAPTNAKITIKDREFTSILNTITFGIFFKDTVNVSITADGNISGIKKIEYQKVAKDTDYNPDGTWTSGSSFNVAPDDKFIVYARVTDNAGNYVVVNSDGIVVDATKPTLALASDTSNWANNDVNVKIEVSDKLAGVKEVTYTTNETVPQTGTVAINSGAGNIKLSNEGQYKLTVTAKDNSLNEVTQAANIKIDKTAPEITSVTGNPTDWTSSNVILTVNASDELSGLADKAYSFDGGGTWQAENTKTYMQNTSNIVVKIKDAAGNMVAYSPIDITKIDRTAPNAAVIANSDKYTESNWYNAAQTITASFTQTAGCTEKLQYKVNNEAWTDSESVTISDEGKHDVSFRVVDSLGCTSTVQTVKVNIDKTTPANAKITVKDREFTSILNTITFGIFFKDTVNVSITADGNISGIKRIEYQKVAKDTDYNPDGTWTNGSSFNAEPDDKFIVYAKITDNAENYVVVNSDGIVVDSTNPDLALTSDADDWTSSDVNVKVEASDKLAGVKEVTYTTDEQVSQSGTVAISDGVGTIKLSNEGHYKLTVTAKDNSGNEVSQKVDIKIDRTIPKLTGAAEASNYFIGRVIKFTDDFGEIASVTYKKDAADEVSFNNEALFDNPGKYDLTLKDKAGNVAKLSFAIKAMPKVEEVIYSADCKALIDSIRAEFDSHNDLPEPYKTNADNEIKALEARYAKLYKEVIDIKSETSVIKGKVDVLPKGIDGLLSLKKEIQDKYNKIAGNTSTLTQEQKLALEKEADYLKQQLNIIAELQNQIDSIKAKVSSIDTKEDGLISKEGNIKELLGDIYKLTKEQQHILQPQVDILNGLLNKINVLKEGIETVKAMINQLPSAAKVTKQNLDQLTNVDKAYNKLSNEQKGLVGEYLVKWLNDCLDALSKLMLHNEENDLTVIGVDGTKFDSDVYLVVTPIKVDSTSEAAQTKFAISAESVKKAADTISEIKNKELVALYDVSLFKDNVKVQPDGKVKVKIKVPEELKGRSGLDIVHIADDGTVTPMHAVVEDGYLVFITDHFSDYAIVAEPIEKTIPKTGSVVDFNSLVIAGVVLTIAGFVIVRRKRRKA